MAINDIEFKNNLGKAITWTDELSKEFDYENGFYGTVFRQTSPVVNGHFLYNIDIDYAMWNIDDYDPENYQKALDQVLKQREKVSSAKLDSISELGRILCFEIGCTTHDGAMIVESQCFFDESDVPPIDTWFYLERRIALDHGDLLYCWIPKAFECVVKEGMKYDLFESNSWYNELA